MLAFGLLLLVPGDPTVAVVGDDAPPALREQVRRDLHLHQPVPVQYGYWLQNALRGDLGTSFRRRGQKVAGLIGDSLPATAELTLLAMLVSAAIGIPAGILSARRRGS